MKIELPQDVKISKAMCSVGQILINGENVKTPATCQWSQQTMTIEKFLVNNYVPSETSSIVFTISEFTNPVSVSEIKGFKATLVAKKQIATNEFKEYAIDMYNGLLPWLVKTGSFKNVKVTASSYIAYQQDIIYTFAFTPDHTIPQNGYLEVTLPAELFVPDRSFTQSSCKPIAESGFTTPQITCQFVDTQTAVEGEVRPNVLKILSAFRRNVGTAGIEYKFTLQGIQNPESTEVTSSFGFTSFSSSKDPIDFVNKSITIKMEQNAKLQTVQVSLGSYDNSALTDYTFTLVSTI